jgi:CheY-like chemotaxis protein
MNNLKPIVKRPLQMFSIEFAATLILVFFSGIGVGAQLFLYPLMAGGAAGVAGLFVGLLEQSMLGAQASSGVVLGGGALKPKKKAAEAKPEEAAEPEEKVPALRSVAPRPAEAGATPSARPPAQPAPATAQIQEQPAGRAAEPAGVGVSSQSPATGSTEDRLPPWMERAMAQARQSAETTGEPTPAETARPLTEEELRAQLEQPVSMAMPVKSVEPSASAQAPDQLDTLLAGVGAPAPGAPSGSPPSPGTSAAPPAGSTRAASSVRAAIIHTDRDQRRHIGSALQGFGLEIAFEADSEQDALLRLLEEPVDLIVTGLDVTTSSPAEYVEKLRRASQFAVIVSYGTADTGHIKEVACNWPPGGPLPAQVAKMLGLQ